MLLLSHFSRVRLCATSETAAHQAPQSLEFSRQEHWSGLHFFLQWWKWKVKAKSLGRVQLAATLGTAAPGSSIHGIFQARVLEWGAISHHSRVIKSRGGNPHGKLYPGYQCLSAGVPLITDFPVTWYPLNSTLIVFSRVQQILSKKLRS